MTWFGVFNQLSVEGSFGSLCLFVLVDEHRLAALLNGHHDHEDDDCPEEDDARAGGAEAEPLSGAGISVRGDLAGLGNRSPIEAPSGRVSTYAAQKAKMALRLNFLYARAMTAMSPANKATDLPYPRLYFSATRSPAAGAESEREQDGRPIEGFTLGGVNRVDRKCLFARIPDAERDEHQGAEDDGAGRQRHVEVLDHVVGDQRADDAQQHDHGNPVSPPGCIREPGTAR